MLVFANMPRGPYYIELKGLFIKPNDMRICMVQYFKVRSTSRKINVYVLPLGGEPCDLSGLTISIHLAIMATMRQNFS